MSHLQYSLTLVIDLYNKSILSPTKLETWENIWPHEIEAIVKNEKNGKVY